MTVLRYDEIRYLEGDRNYTTFHDNSGESLLVSRNLAYYEKLIDSSSFFRIHQSYLVNIKCVAGLQPRGRQGNISVVLKNGEELPLARAKKKAFIDRLGGE